MSANPEGPIEIAMTHVIGSDGTRRHCPRPSDVRSIANRLFNWRSTAETCNSCVGAPAVTFRRGEALCGRCREQRNAQTEGMERLDVQVMARRGEAAGGDGFHGYAVVFNELSEDLGGFRERIMPEAGNRTLKENIDVRALWNHNSDITLGRLSANTMSIRKDAVGVAVEIVPPSWAASHMESVDRGDVTGMSFAFRAVDDEWFMDGPMPTRHVLDMRVSEVSGVTFPAYPQTTFRVSRGLRLRSDARRDDDLSHRLRVAL